MQILDEPGRQAVISALVRRDPLVASEVPLLTAR
jgi:hypothetical protein